MDLVSHGALRVSKVVWQSASAELVYTVVCKATFELAPDLSPLAATQEPVVEQDQYSGDEHGGLALATDLVPFKRPEVLLIGHAYAPDEIPVPSLVARLVVGEVDKAIRVVGDRRFERNGRLGEPEPFTRARLAWDRAAGGPGTQNPAGVSLGAGAKADFFGRVPAPSLLPPELTLTSRNDLVPPVGFGPIAPLWPSRAARLHRHEGDWDPARWHERPLPADIDLAHFNAAPADQQRTEPFGSEPLYLENLHWAHARLSTRLAPVEPTATVEQALGPKPLALRCDTLVLDTDRGLAMLVWRAHVLLKHPGEPGRVTVTGPPTSRRPPVSWTRPMLDELTPTHSALRISTPVLPFSNVAVELPRPSSPPPKRGGGATAPAPLEAAGQSAAHPFVAPGAPASSDAPPESAGGWAPPPFFARERGSAPPGEDTASATAELDEDVTFLGDDDDGDGPPTPRRADSASYPLPPPPDISIELPSPPAPPDDLYGAMAPAGPSPWALPSAPMWGAPEIAPLPQDSGAPPDAPATDPVEPVEASDGALAEAPAATPAREVAFEAYPPERCGAIAARLACGDQPSVDVLRAEDLDGEGWQKVHEHWLDRIREEASRSRKKLLSDYDGAYVSALEAQRGPISVAAYAELAEAAERGAAQGVLAERGLPEAAWPHVHRVWIARMVKDVKLGKDVRAAIDELREEA